MPQDGPRRGVGPPNQILMVSVAKIEYDVTVEVLQQVFQKFGNVQKIVTFWKNDEFKALVQMESVDQAQAAQSALDGRDIYTGCNQLSIVFSRHPELNVRFNNTHSRDYTNPNLPPGPSGPGDTFGDEEPAVDFAPRERRGVSPAPVGDGGYGQPPPGRNDLDYRGPSGAPDVGGVYIFGKKLRIDYSKHTSVSMPHADADRFELDNTLDFSGSPLHRYHRRSPQEAVSPCPLLHISGIPMELQRNQNALVDLFAPFGLVKDFHFLQNNSKMALVEMGSQDEAIMALIHLDNLAYPDSHMRVSFSKAFQTPPGPGPLPGPGAGMGGWNQPPMQPRPRGRSRERAPQRDQRDRSFRDRGPPPQRGRDNSRRPPPRY
ncbi:hypothetical protein BBJ28_00024831 [Nothophytophthora sp. Chile5]|nr:hypothetical protein BBJ28_00024831 [Nothophytophthora sp. Chile5]